jgi:acetylornithine deacetylase/succinyl-diaminopimelate desuccinylase-like protein
MSGALPPVLERLETDRAEALKRLFTLLRIPSISTDPAYRKQVQEAAELLAGDLTSIGFKARIHATPGQPILTATHPGPGPEAPHILYYGHYDVQPPDPVELWESPPFEPVLVDGPRGGRIVGRGAVDDKGQLMTFVEAFRAWTAVHGTLPVRVTVLLEGEEETGSPSLDPFLEGHRDELNADCAVICDTAMWNMDTPAITTMLRGLVYTEVTLHGPSHDLHSGMYGGAVLNPAITLARILGELVDGEGRVQIPGFYDDVLEVSETQAAQWADLAFDEAGFLSSAGLKLGHGETGRSTLERIWSRPACDVNGFCSGYIGDGAKTVIGSSATAKVSCRLVADQDPQRIYENLVAFFRDRTPPGGRFQFACHGASAAVRVSADSPYLTACRRGLAATFQKEPVLIGCGGSIPIAGSFQRIFGFDPLLVGFGLEDDRMHSPNEKFELSCFERGADAHAAILSELAEVPRAAGAAR